MIFPSSPNSIQKGCDLLRSGRVVVMPTETVYGLAADATSDHAVAQIYTLKNRPQFNPLIIHVPALAQAEEIAVFSQQAYALANKFWPGSLTLVLPRRSGHSISDLASAGLDTVAVRIPNHPVALDLLKAYGKPLAAPSANRSTEISPTQASDVQKAFGEDIFILEGGPCQVGVESTIVDLTGERPVLLRPGGVSVEQLESVLGPIDRISESSPIKAPGMMRRHYAPTRPLRLNITEAHPKEAILGFGKCEDLPVTLNLSPSGDLVEAAAHLFRMLRELDSPTYEGIAVVPIPTHGLGLAINDRLSRAATPVE